MSLFRVAAPRQGMNPVRVLAWNASIRAGDDLKLAFSLVGEDGETPEDVTSANARLALFPDHLDGRSWDYGFVRRRFIPEMTVAGYVVDGHSGRINFMLPATSTAALCHGRYRMFVEVDQPDGVTTEAEGILQVRPGLDALGNAPRPYMRIGSGEIGVDLIPALVINGLPCDADGFPLLQFIRTPGTGGSTGSTGSSAVLGIGIPGQMVLGSSSGSLGVLGQMVLGG